MNTKVLFVTIILTFPILVQGQKYEMEVQLSDIEDALNTAGIEISKFDFGEIREGHRLIFYLEEIIHDTIYKSYEFPASGINSTNNGKNAIKIITKRNSYNSESFIINFIFPKGENKKIIKIHEEYQTTHIWKKVEEGEVIFYAKTPMLLYGSMWEDKAPDGRTIYRLCMDTYISRDLSNDDLEKINHMFLLSYKIIKS